MADYEITFDAGSYNVNVDTSTPSYNLGVNYEIPSKSTQYTNVLVDDIKAEVFSDVESYVSPPPTITQDYDEILEDDDGYPD